MMVSGNREPWYRRPLTGRQHAALLIATLLVAATLVWATFRYGWRIPGTDSWPMQLVMSLLPCVASWPLLSHSSRWAPLLGVLLVTAAASLGVMSSVPKLTLVLALSLVALCARPRPNRHVIRICSVAITLLAASAVLPSG